MTDDDGDIGYCVDCGKSILKLLRCLFVITADIVGRYSS